jgi:transcriptional regulator with XRE-family HTH domain
MKKNETQTLDTYVVNIGRNIKRLRKEKKISQKQLAEKLNVTHFWICKLESGKRNTTIFRLNEIAFYLETDLINLITEK